MSADNDNEVGFWLYGVPYVWINDADMKKCRRLYVVYNQDEVMVSRRTHLKHDMAARRVEYRQVGGKENLSLDDMSLLDLWGSDSRRKTCSWATRYFGVYNHTLFKGRKLNEMDVRVNGKSVPPKRSVLDYLQAYRVPKAPKFIKYPEWLTQNN